MNKIGSKNRIPLKATIATSPKLSNSVAFHPRVIKTYLMPYLRRLELGYYRTLLELNYSAWYQRFL